VPSRWHSRVVQIGAIGRRQEAPGPDVELVGEFEAANGIQYFDPVGRTVIFGVEGHLDVVGDRAIQIQADSVELEPLHAAVRRMRHTVAVDAARGAAKNTGLHAGAYRDRRQAHVRRSAVDARQPERAAQRRGEPRTANGLFA